MLQLKDIETFECDYNCNHLKLDKVIFIYKS